MEGNGNGGGDEVAAEVEGGEGGVMVAYGELF